MNFCIFSMFVRASRPLSSTPPHTHSSAVSLRMCVCLLFLCVQLVVRDFAAVIKFHVSFTTCYNISIWFALLPCLFLIYFRRRCRRRFVYAAKKTKREMWKIMKKISKACRTLASQHLYKPSELNAEFVVYAASKHKKKQKQKRNKWRAKRDSYSA